MSFTNETINISELPKFEEVSFLPLHRDYWKIVLIKTVVFFTVVAFVFTSIVYFDLNNNDGILGIADYLTIKIGAILLLFLFVLVISRIGFKKKGYAFRQHDVLYKSGVISETTTIIPYSRIQHVALHEGFIARQFGLASVQIFTAGGGNSDIEIPGIEKDKAQNIKQLLMSKLTTDLTNIAVENE